MPTRRKRKTMAALQQSAIEMVRGKACIVFERTGEKVCRKTMVCSTPIRVPVLLSSFHPFLPVSPRSRPRLEVLMKTWPTMIPRAATCRTDRPSHPWKILSGNPPPLFRRSPLFRERGTSLFFSFVLPFHLSVRVNTFWRRIEIKSHFFLREFVL